MYIGLEKNDCIKIAQAIADSDKENGCVYVDINGLEFECAFSKEVDGYTEDDYHNGTGAFVCTYADVRIKGISCCDLDLEVREYGLESIQDYTERILKS